MVFANGNAGPDHATKRPANSPRSSSGRRHRTQPSCRHRSSRTGTRARRTGRDASRTGAVRPQITRHSDRRPTPAQVASGGSTLGCTAFPAGSLTGAIALIERSTCEFSTKVFNAQQAARSLRSSTTRRERRHPQSMGQAARPQVTIPSWFMRRRRVWPCATTLAHPGEPRRSSTTRRRPRPASAT
jgi:hypothetical protein